MNQATKHVVGFIGLCVLVSACQSKPNNQPRVINAGGTRRNNQNNQDNILQDRELERRVADIERLNNINNNGVNGLGINNFNNQSIVDGNGNTLRADEVAAIKDGLGVNVSNNSSGNLAFDRNFNNNGFNFANEIGDVAPALNGNGVQQNQIGNNGVHGGNGQFNGQNGVIIRRRANQ